MASALVRGRVSRFRPLVALVPAAALVGCGVHRPPVPAWPEPVAYADTLPIPEPEEKEFDERYYLLRDQIGKETIGPVLPTASRETGEALNLTHHDDVVSSAWFEHRNGREPMTLAEIRRGPTTTPPDTTGPLTIVAAKTEGVMPGFTIEDASGERFLIKLDSREYPGLGSGAGVIANRLFHAAGYHVPEDFVFELDADRLVLDPELEAEDEGLTMEAVHTLLERAAEVSEGRYRGLASKFVPGTPKGPFRFEGRWEDDPNDHYEHQYRRELRGLFVLAAWLNHVDLRFANSLDVYIDPPGYIRHYLIDFASSLGSSAGLRPHTARHGDEYQVDVWPVLFRFATLGLYQKGWESEEIEPIHPSVGWLPTESYEPGDWKPGWPNRAFLSMSERDGYWGAKLVASFTEEQIRAAVEAGRLPDEVADTLSKILIYRRDETVRHWFSRVSPVEGPRIEIDPAGATLTVRFEDLGLTAGLREPGETSYRWTFRHPARGVHVQGSFDAVAVPLQRFAVRIPSSPGDTPARADEDSADTERLATLEILVRRPGAGDRPATLYLQWDPGAGRYELAGLIH